MIKYTSFKPAWWLPNPHLQTIWPVIAGPRIKLVSRRERLELPDGDFLDLDWVGTNNDVIVLVLHGLGGSIDSPYAKRILNAIVSAGWQGVFMHFRGCSQDINRLARSYHSGETGDLAYVVKEISERFPNAKLSVIGYSLGGNVLLKWLGENGNALPLQTAVAISVPFELRKVADKMTRGISKFYQWWLLRQLKKDVSRKFTYLKSPIDLVGIQKLKTFWEFDDKVTAPLHGFANVEHYYQCASSRQYLKDIAIPTLILHAVDDPFMIPDAIPHNDELSKSVTLELSKFGGHVGFVEGAIPGRSRFWLERRIPLFINSHL